MALYLLFPLCAGFLYALGAVILKRAFAFDAGIMRSVFLANLFMGVAFAPLFFFEPERLSISQLGYPILVGTTFFLGQLFTFVAMRVGDVSLATPILGTKVLFVALTSFLLFGEHVPLVWWVGAALTAVAILLLGASDLAGFRKHLKGIFFAVVSAAFFGLTDAMLPVLAADVGKLGFVSVMFAVVALWSFVLVPFFNAPLRTIDRRAWPWLGLGVSILGIQSLIMALTLSFFGNPTAVNILYSGRGLWALLLVIFLGKLLQSTEGNYSRKTMALRLLGAVLLMVAIILVLLNPEV